MEYWFYEDSQNHAYLQDLDIDEVQFFLSEEHNFFQVCEEEGGFIRVTATDAEVLSVKDVTKEQAVILFATVRGLKEAARE